MRYCLNCGAQNFSSPCQADNNGSHRVVIKGQKKYRVRKINGDGYVYLLSCVPDGYELVEEIEY